MNIRLKLYCIYIINKKKLYSSCVLFLEPLGTMLCLKKKFLFMNKDNALKKKKGGRRRRRKRRAVSISNLWDKDLFIAIGANLGSVWLEEWKSGRIENI